MAALIAYDGREFAGFQRQPGRATVEGAVIGALTGIGLSGGLGFASRTDAGVHAFGQVVAFKVPADLPVSELQAALQRGLPASIRVRALAPAPARFHPRWSAAGKEYVYRWTTSEAARISADLLERGCDALRGCERLDGFTAAGAPPRPAPPLTSLTIERLDGAFALRFTGPAFRRYAIRHMVACLEAEGRGEAATGLAAGVAMTPPPYRGARAAAGGLTLDRVLYPAELDPFARSSESSSSA